MLALYTALALLVPATLAHKGGENYMEARERLKRDLFHHYDKTVIPMMEEKRPVNASAGLSVHSMDMDDTGLLTMVAWAHIMWDDERLAWHPEDYHGLKQMRVPANEVWVPDMEIYMAEDFGDGSFSDAMYGHRDHNVVLFPSGKVLYVPPTRVTTRCAENDFEDWPWGVYECGVKLGSWTYSAEELDLHAWNNFIKFEETGLKNSPMVFVEGSFEGEAREAKKYECCPEDYLSVNYKFKVQREYRLTENGVERNPNGPVARYSPPEGAKFF